jgi:hypothetical protein
MGYVKSMLPDDWEPEHYQSRKYKYLCKGGTLNPNIIDQWLPRWYGIPFEECLFSRDWVDDSGCIKDWQKAAEEENLMLLTDLPKGTNYKQHLKILKTERLLNG